jgi:hypothetical protein
LYARCYKVRLRVELSGLQVTPPIESPVVSHLDNPGPGGAFRSVKDSAFSLDIEKQVLDEIFCLGSVPQDADSHASNQPRITFEESGQSFPVSCANLTDQRFIGDIWDIGQIALSDC